MIRILFVCHGNICRSPMAEYIMKELCKNDKDIYIESRATSFEEIGNDIYPPAKRVLSKNNIPYNRHHATHLELADCNAYDYLIGMDSANIRNMRYIAGENNYNKIYKLLSFNNEDRDVSDPWYTDNFDKAYNDIYNGCFGLYRYIKK